MAQQLNINGSDDPAYRYKMPRLIGKVEGAGNGIKTVIVNCSDIAQSLGRSTPEVTKFFGCELGAQARYIEKEDRAIVNGAFDTKDLQEKLFIYIRKFIQCPSCQNPETVPEVKGKKKSAQIYLSCKACGAYELADNTHKLCTFIIKEHSTKAESGTDKDKKKTRKDKKSKGADAEDEDADTKEKKKKKKNKSKDKDKKKSKKKKEKEGGDGGAVNGVGDGDGYDDWADEGVNKLTVDDDAAALALAQERLLVGINALAPFDGSKIYDLVCEVARTSGMEVVDRFPIFYCAVLAKCAPKDIAKYEAPIRAFVTTVADQVLMLALMEQACCDASGIEQAKLISYTPLSLKAYYDMDVLDEEIAINWYEGMVKIPGQKRRSADIIEMMKAKARPFIEFLEQDDESGSDEEESDEE